VPDQLEQPVSLEREPDQVVERIAEDRDDCADDRQDQPVRNGAAQNMAARKTPSPPGKPGGDGSRRWQN